MDKVNRFRQLSDVSFMDNCISIHCLCSMWARRCVYPPLPIHFSRYFKQYLYFRLKVLRKPLQNAPSNTCMVICDTLGKYTKKHWIDWGKEALFYVFKCILSDILHIANCYFVCQLAYIAVVKCIQKLRNVFIWCIKEESLFDVSKRSFLFLSNHWHMFHQTELVWQKNKKHKTKSFRQTKTNILKWFFEMKTKYWNGFGKWKIILKWFRKMKKKIRNGLVKWKKNWIWFDEMVSLILDATRYTRLVIIIWMFAQVGSLFHVEFWYSRKWIVGIKNCSVTTTICGVIKLQFINFNLVITHFDFPHPPSVPKHYPIRQRSKKHKPSPIQQESNHCKTIRPSVFKN